MPVRNTYYRDERQQRATYGVLRERDRQERLRDEGAFSHTLRDREMSHHFCLAAVTEELGEIAQAILNYEGLASDPKYTVFNVDQKLREEVTELAALCLAWLEGEW